MVRTPLSVVTVDDSCFDCPVSRKGVCLRYGQSLRNAIAKYSVDALVRKGSVLAYSGDDSAALFIVKQGELKAVRSLQDGRQQIVGFARAGDVIGNPQGQDIFDCTFEALTDCILCKTRVSDLRGVSAEHPEYGAAFMDAVANEIRRRGDQAVLLGRKKAEERLASFIVERSMDVSLDGSSCHLQTVISLPMSRLDIADYLGLTIETVSRVLTNFKNRRLIDIANKTRIDILDPDALKEISCDEQLRSCNTRIFL